MGAVNASTYKDFSNIALWSEDEKWVKGSYSFAADTGESDDTYNLIKIPTGYVIVDGYMHVTTAIDGTSSTVEVGFTGATAGIFAQTAEATLIEDYVLSFVGKKIVTANNTIFLTIGTADLTAGAFEIYLKLKKAS